MAALMEQAKAQAALDALAQIEDDTALVTVIVEMLRHKPQICPAVIAATCPELTYAPSKAITERRATGHMKTISAQGGYGFIQCPDLYAIFGCDIFAHMKQIGEIRPGTEVSFAVLLNKDNKPQAFDIAEVESWGGGGGSQDWSGGGGGKGGGVVKSKLCRDWQAGGCQRGSSCWFAHGEEEIGTEIEGKGGKGGGWDGGGDGGKGGGKGGGRDGGWDGGASGKGGWDGGGWDGGGDGGADPMAAMQALGGGGADPMAAVQAMLGLLGGAGGAAGLGGLGSMGGCGGGGGKGGKNMGGADGVDVDIGQYEGTLVKFNEAKGMGFIQSVALGAQGHGDVFIHAKNLNGFQVGDMVTFEAFLHKGHRLQGRDLQGEPGNGKGAHMLATGNMEPPAKIARTMNLH